MAYYSTGLDVLDDRLGGGLPEGTVSVLETPPGSAGLLVAAAFASVPSRPTAYLSTDRHPDQVRTDVAAAIEDRGDTPDSGLEHLVVSMVDDAAAISRAEWNPQTGERGNESDDADAGSGTDSTNGSHPENEADSGNQSDHLVAAGEEVTELVTALERTGGEPAGTAESDGAAPVCLVFDTLSALQSPRESTRDLETFETLQSEIRDLDGVGLVVLVRPHGVEPPSQAARILHRADAVFRYSTNEEGTDRLVVRRVSGAADGCAALPFSIPLRVTDVVQRDPDDSFS